jgi:hypothetical protein
MKNLSKLKQKKKPASCTGCPYWEHDEAFGYRVCVVAGIAGSPKFIPRECPIYGTPSDNETSLA